MLSTHRRRRQGWVWTVVASAPRHLLHSKYVDIGVDLNGCVIVYVGDGVKALDQFGCQRSFLFWSSRLLLFVCYVLVLCLFWTTPSGALSHDSNYLQDSDGQQQGNCLRWTFCKRIQMVKLLFSADAGGVWCYVDNGATSSCRDLRQSSRWTIVILLLREYVFDL